MGLGFRVWGVGVVFLVVGVSVQAERVTLQTLGFRVKGTFGLRVYSDQECFGVKGFSVKGLLRGTCRTAWCETSDPSRWIWFRVSGFGYRVPDFRFWIPDFRVLVFSGFRFWYRISGFWVLDFGFRVSI